MAVDVVPGLRELAGTGIYGVFPKVVAWNAVHALTIWTITNREVASCRSGLLGLFRGISRRISNENLS